MKTILHHVLRTTAKKRCIQIRSSKRSNQQHPHHQQIRRKDYPNFSEINQIRSRYCQHRKFALAPPDGMSSLMKNYQDSNIVMGLAPGSEIAMGYRVVDSTMEAGGMLTTLAEQGESMIATFMEAIAKVRQLTLSNDDELIDRFSRRYTVIMLTLFAVIVSTKQYVGDPIACWTPAQFTGAHVEYTNYICWVSNKYFVDFDNRLPGRDEVRHHKIAYYQWVPFILLTMTICFYAPSLIWKFYAIEQGIDIGSINRSLLTIDDINWANRTKTINTITGQVSTFLLNYYKTASTSTTGKRSAQLCILYAIVKMLYIMNALGQLFLLELFIGDKRKLAYGMRVMFRVISGGDWSLSRRFPRVTYCDFTIRTMGDNLHQHTVQCVLPINLFNEKIFIIMWFWSVFVSISSTYGLIRFFWLILIRFSKIHHLLNLAYRTKSACEIAKHQENLGKYSKLFVDNYLGVDGCLIIHLISINTNELLAAEILDRLWKDFCAQKRTIDSKSNLPRRVF